jgi:hypothetical protein
MTGHWKITGRDTANWTGSNLVIVENDGKNFNGYFDWYRSGITYSGREYFRGVYDPKSRGVVIKGYRLENPIGIILGTYKARLASNGSDFISGTWGGPGTGGASGTWEAKFQN